MHTRGHLRLALCSLACIEVMPIAQAAVGYSIVPTPELVMAPAIVQFTATADNSNRVAPPDTVITAASPRFNHRPVSTDQQLSHLPPMLRRNPERKVRAEACARQLTNPHTPNFRRWLTAQQVGDLPGPSFSQDTVITINRLTSQGLHVDGIDPTSLRVHFSGKAIAIQSCLHAEPHNYTANGVVHFANTTPQQIPTALGQAVVSMASLNDFNSAPGATQEYDARDTSIGCGNKREAGTTGPPGSLSRLT